MWVTQFELGHSTRLRPAGLQGDAWKRDGVDPRRGWIVLIPQYMHTSQAGLVSVQGHLL